VASSLLDGFRVLGFDLETTGFNPRSDRIVQFALVGSDADGTHVRLQSLVNPGSSIPSESSKVHGITDRDLVGKSGFGEHLGKFTELAGGSVIVGHNVIDFDWRFIEVECARLGAEVPVPHAILDTLLIARSFGVPRPHKLGVLCDRFGISMERSHSADADAGATLLLLWKFMKAYPERFRGDLKEFVESLSQRA
tara:strand:- start:2875 stop:3459 length:585 start_codon:yes stop_codon:yes gene_type:complete